jgi:hypothetical protein
MLAGFAKFVVRLLLPQPNKPARSGKMITAAPT